MMKRYKQPYPPGVLLPEFKIDDDFREELGIDKDTKNIDILRRLCKKGWREKEELRDLEEEDRKKYAERFEKEIDLLEDLGFVDYILLNWDIINFCKMNGIPTGAGRGSAAGSLILYLLGVTNINPIKYDLFFERFVSESRKGGTIDDDGQYWLDGSLLADIDNDISYDRRGEVIAYIERKYKGSTSKILTLNTLSSKLCIKECGKIVSELSEDQVNEISSSIPKQFGKVAKLKEAYEDEDKRFKGYADKYPKAYKIARKLEGLVKNTGVHPSGIAICRGEQKDIMPVQKTADGALVSGYDMNDVAELSVKFDILGLRTLSVVSATCDKLGIKMEDVNKRMSDADITEMLEDLKSPKGLFHIEADTAYKVCRKVRPRNLEELSAVVAIARPGALEQLDQYVQYRNSGRVQRIKFNRDANGNTETFDNAFFDDILGYTGGLPLYQEQLMKMAHEIGFSLNEAEQLRRIVGKKKVDQMAQWEQKINDKIKKNGLDPKIGQVLWEVAKDSANYSFNKSHSIAYSNLVVTTLYLKFKHPKEFFLSLLKFAKSEPDSYEEIAKISKELHSFNIELKPPCLKSSDEDFKIEGEHIRYGLNTIKGVSSNVIKNLLEFRGNTFDNKYEVFIIAKQVGLSIGIVSSLIQAGLMDSFVERGETRSDLVFQAQMFNILTDREKPILMQHGEKYNYNIIDTIDAAIAGDILDGEKEKRIFRDTRINTINKKREGYEEIRNRNQAHPTYANWFFENEILGYNHSCSIRDVFKDLEGYEDSQFVRESTQQNDVINFVGSVSDVVKNTSRAGNLYLRLIVSDEKGSVPFLFMDNNRERRLTDYTDAGNKLPKKGDVVIIKGNKGNDDIVFAETIQIESQKIYMKLSQVK